MEPSFEAQSAKRKKLHEAYAGTYAFHPGRGHLYRIIGASLHSETLACEIVYAAAGPRPGEIWHRPADMFLDGRFLLLPRDISLIDPTALINSLCNQSFICILAVSQGRLDELSTPADEECMRGLAEMGILAHSPDGYSLTRPGKAALAKHLRGEV